MNVTDQIISDMVTRMAKEIDQSIIDDITMETLIQQGWTQTKVNPGYTDLGMMSGRFEQWYSQTAEWVHLNATGDYKLIKGQWLFENAKDATMFILRWA